jgi:hypothetical protein
VIYGKSLAAGILGNLGVRISASSKPHEAGDVTYKDKLVAGYVSFCENVGTGKKVRCWRER